MRGIQERGAKIGPGETGRARWSPLPQGCYTSRVKLSLLRSFRQNFVLFASIGFAFGGCGAPGSTTKSDSSSDLSTDDRSGGDLGDDLVRTEDDLAGTGASGNQGCKDEADCTCLRLALLGNLDSKAVDKDTSAFVDWLNGSSGGTAKVTMFEQKPSFDAAFFEEFDILIVANVNSWSFSGEEKDAVAAWVRDAGGGILTLTGFTSESNEPTATSQLLEFSGISYGSTRVAERGENLPIYYRGGTENLRNCLVRNGVSSNDAVITTPIAFSAESGDYARITQNLEYVGAYIGWEVVPSSDATVIAVDPTTQKPMVVVKQVGQGRVFVFGDEWVIFANQWVAQGTPTNMQMDAYNPCWVEASASPTGSPFFHSVSSLYQTKQFWFNAVTWLAPAQQCEFVVIDDDVILK